MTDLEIIKKLATEFMGWHTKVWQNGEADFHWEDADGNHVAKFSTIPWGEENPELTWNPLHDPAACALVLDEIERRGWSYVIRFYPAEEYEVSIRYPEKGAIQVYEICTDTRYRAVCLAILEACEVTE